MSNKVVFYKAEGLTDRVVWMWGSEVKPINTHIHFSKNSLFVTFPALRVGRKLNMRS